MVGEGFALILRGAAVGAVAGVGAELLAMVPKMAGAGARARNEREERGNLIAMGLDPDNLPVPGSPEYAALVQRLSGQVSEKMEQERERVVRFFWLYVSLWVWRGEGQLFGMLCATAILVECDIFLSV